MSVDQFSSQLTFTGRGLSQLTTLSGRDVVADFPNSDTAKSSSAGGFSLNTSRPLVASSGSSGSLRLFQVTSLVGYKANEKPKYPSSS